MNLKALQTPNSCHSRKGSVKVQRQPLAVISNCPEFNQCASYLQQKVQGLEMRVKNLNSQHIENRSTTAQRNDASLSPFNKPKKPCSSQKMDSQSYYETIINKRLENISKLDQSPVHVKTDNSQIPDKYSVHSNLSNYQSKLHGNCITRIQQLTKKLRKFKTVKDQNQDECAPSLAKIKCFCQEYYNDCFDFYRCTDLIALKYFIYLLLQEINTLYSQDAFKMADNQLQYQHQIEMLKEQLDNQKTDQMTFQSQLKLQKMVVDTQKLIQEIINVLQTKHNQSTLINQVEVLNTQIKTIKENMSTNQTQMPSQNTTSFGQQLAKYGYEANYPQGPTNDSSLVNQSNYKTQEERHQTQFSSKSKSPYCRNQKNLNFEFDQQADMTKKLLEEQTVVNRQLMEKLFKLQNEKSPDQGSLIKQLQEENRQMNQQIKELEYNLQNENSSIQKQLNQRILEINKNLDQVVGKNQELVKENEIQRENIDQYRQIEQKYYDLLQENNKYFQQLNQALKDNSQLQKLQQQIEAECKGYSTQVLKLQEKCEAQYAQLQDQNDAKGLQQQINELLVQQSEQSKIIQLITDEALYLGQMTLYASDILQRQPMDGIPTTLVMLQKDLNSKRSTIQQKMKILQQFGNNMKLSHSNSNLHDYDLLENLHSEPSSLRVKNASYYDETASTVNSNSSQNDLMTMLVIQCHTLEKMMEF